MSCVWPTISILNVGTFAYQDYFLKSWKKVLSPDLFWYDLKNGITVELSFCEERVRLLITKVIL